MIHPTIVTIITAATSIGIFQVLGGRLFVMAALLSNPERSKGLDEYICEPFVQYDDKTQVREPDS